MARRNKTNLIVRLVDLGLVSLFLHSYLYPSSAQLVDFTCVNENPVLSPDTPSNVIAVYKSSDTLRASEVAFGRTVYTGTGYNLPQCLCLIPGVLGQESLITQQQMRCPSSACQCNEDSTCLYRIGAFFCQIEGAAQTKITTVTLKSSAAIRPERQTITVNRGESVTLTITTSSPKSEFRWRKNTELISDWKNVQSPNIRNVTVNHAGVYECHERKLRPKGQHAIFKLIVRGCSANKWGSSTGCQGVCPVCYNGGMCDDQTGQCICAPGFSGSNCHIVHGRNVFGLSGTLRCDESEGRHATSCRGRLFCLQDPFGCVCAAGYKGLDCKQECDQPNTFGPYCSQTCHCADDIQCLSDTGECNDPSCNPDVDGYCPQRCADGWKGNNCQVATPCHAGFYGDLCLKRCNCRDNEPCREDTGVCDNGCADGYIGPTCSQDGTTTIVSFSQTNKPIAGQTVFIECVVVGNPLPTSSDITVVDSLRNPSVPLHFSQESPEINAYRRINQFYVTGHASRDGTQLTCHVNGPTPISQELTLDVFEPPSLVSAPTLGAVTTTSITVRWRPWEQSQDGPVLRYEVHYRLQSDLDDAEYTDNKTAMTNTSTSLVITALVPDTEYDFIIVVVGDPWGSGWPSPKATFRTSCQACTRYDVYMTFTNREGFVSPPSDTVTASTGTVAPGPVDIQPLSGSSYDNLNVAWSAPTENNCPVERYNINHILTRLFACDSVPPTLSTTISQTVSGDVTAVSLNNLKAYSVYRVSVVADNDAGRSPEQVQIKNRGGKAAPSFTPTVTVPQSDITSSSIRLTWTAIPCEELNGVFSHYRILLTNPATMEQTQFDVSGLEKSVNQLTACTTYSIQVAVVNDVGVGRYSVGTRVTTRIAVPGRVEHLTTNAFNGYSTILQVHWARPPGNCPIQFYTISYRLVNRRQCQTTVTSKTIDSGMATGTAYNITGLEPYSTYDVHVTATTAAGVGSGASVRGRTAEAAPSEPPQYVTILETWKKLLSFIWESLPCFGRQGVIIGYSYMLEDQERDVENITGETNGHETSITLSNLVPYTLYSFQVRARTAAGDGPYSDAVVTRTLQAKPPPVSSITTPSADASSITVQWQRPDPPHGIITAYHVVYFIVGQDSDSTTVNIAENLNETVITHKLTGLQADSNYSIQVQAETISVGEPSLPVYRVAQESHPGEPSALAVSRKGERELSVVWDVPTEPNGVIVGYTVKHRVTARPYDPDFAPSSQYETSSLLDPGIRSRTITGLDPATKYEILVSASTQKGEGARGVIEVFTEPASDIPSPETPTMNPKMSTESSVVISIPEVINRFVVSYLVTVKTISTRQRRQSMLKVQDEDFGIFDETPESYVAGEIEKHSHTGTFEIGNNKTYGGYYNPPLQEGTTYEVRSGASSKTDGAPRVSWSEPLTFKAGRIQESPPSDQGNDVEGSSSSAPSVIVVVGVVVVMLIVAVLLLLVYRFRQRRQNGTALPKPQSMVTDQHEMIRYENIRSVVSESTAYESVKGYRDEPLSNEIDVAEEMPTYEDVGLPSWARAWSIAWDNMLIGKKVLGRGNFGEVVNGGVMVKDDLAKAAIKKLKADASPTDRQNFMEEFKTLTQIRRHPNVIGLLGACQHQDILYVALEYLINGDLRTYLRKARCAEDESQMDLCPSKLVQFAHDVAKGMQHLAALGVIHRDLAARNILLDTNLVAKVSDFGLSRGEDIYVQTSKTRVPTRWLSIESITRQEYTSKSDVWSFGVLLWEIASLGATPYEDIKTRNLLSRLENGYRMPKPSNCDQEIYDLMLECWRDEPRDRPSFKKLVTIFQTLANNQKECTYMRVLPKSENFKYLMIRPELDDN